MIKKLLFCSVSVSLLAGCGLFEEKITIIGTPHAAKLLKQHYTASASDWEEFLQKKDAAIAEGESPESNRGNEADSTEPATPEEETIPVVANPAEITVLVNKFWTLPNGYRPADLIKPDVLFSFGNENSDRAMLRKEAAQALEVMFEAAKTEGMELYARSGFRSYETQSAIFQSEIAANGYDQAVLYVALPGTSEHQTGLAMDITAKSVKLELVESFENTDEGQWLGNNAHHYGFILRYPKNKTNITGYGYEPWHYRYIGVEIATEIYEKDITLEEYMGDVREF